MKQRTGRRFAALFLLSVLVCALLCVAAAAAETETEKSSGRSFLYYSASGSSGLIGVPERLYFDEGATILEVLQASGHSFVGLEQGMVQAIDGVTDNFNRGDEAGGYDLTAAARSGQFFCFFTDEGFLTESRQALIREMADYLEKPQDVRNAAKQAYDEACRKFTGADDILLTLQENLAQAIADYEAAQRADGFAVRFTDGSSDYSPDRYAGIVITAVNEYGKTLTDDDSDGVMQLVAGTYTFSVVQSYRRIDGTVTVDGEKTVSAALPSGDWLTQTRLSLSSGEEAFTAAERTITKEDDGHTLRVVVPDTYATGNVYFYADYDHSVFASAPKLYAYYTKTDGTVICPETGEAASRQAWKSYSTSVNRVIPAGAEGGTVVYRVCETDANGYMRSQEYTVLLDRELSLSALRVQDDSGRAQSATELFSPSLREYTYQILSETDTVQIRPTAFRNGYETAINGEAVTDGLFRIETQNDTTEVVLTLTDPETGHTGEYTLRFVKSDGHYTVFELTPASATVSVYNLSGEWIAPADEDDPTAYELVIGQTYRYVVCDQGCYFAEGSFKKDDVMETIPISLNMTDWIGNIWIGKDNASLSDTFGTQSFETQTHRYTDAYLDTVSSMYAAAALVDDDALAAAGVSAAQIRLEAVYNQIGLSQSVNGKEKTVSLSKTTAPADGSAPSRGSMLPYFWQSNALGNTLIIRASRTSGGVRYYQDYTIELSRVLSIGALGVIYSGTELKLEPAYSAAVQEYTVKLPMAARELTLAPKLREAVNMPYGMGDDGYSVRIEDENVQKNTDGTYTATLTGTDETDTIRLVIENSFRPDEATTITLTVQKVPPVYLTTDVQPGQALLVLIDDSTKVRIQPGGSGVWSVSEGFTYDYLLTASGYVGERGTLCAKDGLLTLSNGSTAEITTDAEGNLCAHIGMTLRVAEVNTELNHTIEAEWADFRGTSYTYDAAQGRLVAGGTNYTNNGVISMPTPIEAEKSVLYWANQLGEGYSGSALGCPIMVDGDLIVFAREEIFKVDAISGKVLTKAAMAGASSFAINSPTYYDGMIFVGLSNGRVQAFDAQTLKSLWLYTDELGGQPNCPIIVYDGYLYTGFWNSETGNANYVCLSVTDEDPQSNTEAKVPTWTITQPGGFYWAGSCVNDDFMLLGTDDGQTSYATKAGPNKTAQLLLLNPKTGEVLDRYTGIYADQRSSICYDKETDAYYFTTKGGYFYRARVTGSVGAWKISEVKPLKLNNYKEEPENPAMSTCTPVVYNRRAYIGVSGVGQFVAYSGHNLTVIDLDKWEIAYQVRTQGYAQTSGLLTTAYEQASGNVYVYFFDNFTPGKLRVLSDRQGQTKPVIKTVETYNDKGQLLTYDTPYVLFTPSGDEAQYAICSPIADEYGTIYFKNDSARLMALGPTVTSLNIEKMPAKTTYMAGERFEPDGMVVTVTYSNGKTRDVTDYVTYSTEPLTKEDEEFTITFPYAMYHNVDNADGTSLAGQEVKASAKNLVLTITGDTPAAELDHIEITTAPAKTQYIAGEDFETDGMVVTAVYKDGTKKNLASGEYEIVDGTELKAGTVEITVRYGECTAKQMITVVENDTRILGDVDGGGTVDYVDAAMVYSYFKGKIKFTNEQIAVADVDGNGNVDYVDAAMIYSYFKGKLTNFPVTK